jgi:WD40 repeat protein
LYSSRNREKKKVALTALFCCDILNPLGEPVLKKHLIFVYTLCVAFLFAQEAPDVAVFPQLGHSGMVSSVAFSPDGKRLVSASQDYTIKIWDMENGRELRTLTGHDKEVKSVSWSPDGEFIVSGSDDGTLRIWDAKTGLEKRKLSGNFPYTFSSDCITRPKPRRKTHRIGRNSRGDQNMGC